MASLREINDGLARLGFRGRLGPSEAAKLKERVDPSELEAAIRRAPQDGGALSWLARVLSPVGVVLSGRDQNQGANPETTGTGSGCRLPEGERLSIHVYGGKGAVCFNADMTEKGMRTVSLDGAAATGPRKYGWADKIAIQLTRNEMVAVLSVLCGYSRRCEFFGHGLGKDKGFSIENQGENFFVSVRQKGRSPVAVPMSAEDGFFVSGLLMRQLSFFWGREFKDDAGRLIPFLLGRIQQVKPANAGSSR